MAPALGLGFTSGMPFLLTYSTQSAWLTDAGVPLEGAAKRDPEAEDLGDRRDVGIRKALVLEERHRHRARDVARHAKARDEQQDRDRHRAKPPHRTD
jgi:hypothetical protein